MKLLIYNDQVKEYIPIKEYEGLLRSKFPQVEIFCTDVEDEAKEYIKDAEIVLTLSVPDRLIQIAQELKWIQVIIVGVNHILSLPSLKDDVIITNAQGIHGPQVSEMVFLFMLAFARNFPENVRNQDKRIWKPWTGRRLAGKTIGIIGLGAIGQAIANKAKTFGMSVYGIDKINRQNTVEFFYYPKDLIRVAKEVDFLVLSLPLTAETKHIIGEEVFMAMKPTAYLINVARGQIVDHDALIKCLTEKKIAGAGLDAFPEEPLPETSPLWGLENVIMTPHVSGNIEGYAQDVLRVFEENLRRYLEGERRNLLNYISREQGF
jgi:phosphoglycerate dehydrogenase-like enzyme